MRRCTKSLRCAVGAAGAAARWRRGGAWRGEEFHRTARSRARTSEPGDAGLAGARHRLARASLRIADAATSSAAVKSAHDADRHTRLALAAPRPSMRERAVLASSDDRARRKHRRRRRSKSPKRRSRRAPRLPHEKTRRGAVGGARRGSLTTQPLTTLAPSRSRSPTLRSRSWARSPLSKQALVVGYPLLALWAGTHAYAPALYAVDGALARPGRSSRRRRRPRARRALVDRLRQRAALGADVPLPVLHDGGHHGGAVPVDPLPRGVPAPRQADVRRRHVRRRLAHLPRPADLRVARLRPLGRRHGDGRAAAVLRDARGAARGEGRRGVPEGARRGARRPRRLLVRSRCGRSTSPSAWASWRSSASRGPTPPSTCAGWRAATSTCRSGRFSARRRSARASSRSRSRRATSSLSSPKSSSRSSPARSTPSRASSARWSAVATVLAAFAGAQPREARRRFELAERLTVNVLLEKARTAKDGGKKRVRGGDADLLGLRARRLGRRRDAAASSARGTPTRTAS